jgi:soluble lytic murein transglycosylase-like protein
MQLMPSVISDMGVGDPWDPRDNVLGGTRLLRVLADRFDGDIVKVLAAYHAGSGAVTGAEGIPYEATESYVRSVLDRYYEYRSRRE